MPNKPTNGDELQRRLDAAEKEIVRLQAAVADAEADSERLQDRLKLVGEAAKVGIWEYSFVDDELWISDELATMYGLTSIQRTWPEFASRLHPDDRVDEVLRPTPSFPFGRVNEFFFRVRHSDGHYLSIRSRSTTYGFDDTPTRKIGAHIDMTEDELLRLNAELAEVNDRLRQFSYMASHDLKSPLRGIAGSLSMMKLKHEKAMSPDQIKILDAAQARAQQMGRLVSDLLGYATCDLHQAPVETVDVNQVVDDIAGLIDTEGHKIVVNSSVDAPVRLHSNPLATCIRNLVDNACKHHDRSDGVVTVTLDLDGSWLQVEVSDDGPGIPELARSKVFDPFYSSDRTRSSGLGLAHVRETVEKFNGTIELTSEVDVGTTFSLRWPILRQGGTARGSSG